MTRKDWHYSRFCHTLFEDFLFKIHGIYSISAVKWPNSDGIEPTSWACYIGDFACGQRKFIARIHVLSIQLVACVMTHDVNLVE